MQLKNLLDIATKDVSVISPVNCLYDRDGMPSNRPPAVAKLIIDLVTEAYQETDYTDDPMEITHAAAVNLRNAKDILETCLANLDQFQSEEGLRERLIASMQEARERATRHAAARKAKASSKDDRTSASS